jgi:hypothetical protein
LQGTVEGQAAIDEQHKGFGIAEGDLLE